MEIGKLGRVSVSPSRGARTVPVAYPASADWPGSPNLHIGTRADARARYAVVLDPVAGTLTALRMGQVVAVTVNGVTRQSTVALSARAAWPEGLKA